MKSIEEIERLKELKDRAWEAYLRAEKAEEVAFVIFDRARTAYIRASEER